MEFVRRVQHPLPCAACDRRWLMVTGLLQLSGLKEVPEEDVQAAVADRRVEVLGSQSPTPTCAGCRGDRPKDPDLEDLPPGLDFVLNEWRLQGRFLRRHLEAQARGHNDAMNFVAKTLGHRGRAFDLELYVRQALLAFERGES